MTHRTEIEAVEETATIGYAAAFALEAGCSRIPVFHEDLDNVQGILYVKDLLPFVGKPCESSPAETLPVLLWPGPRPPAGEFPLSLCSRA